MLLYRLQDKQTKRFFCGIRWYDGKIVWSDSGQFFKRPDTIRHHLTYLIGEYVAREKDGFLRWAKYKGSLHFKYHERWDKDRINYQSKGFRFYRNRLKLYRVIIDDVSVMGQKKVNAKNFMDKQPK